MKIQAYLTAAAVNLKRLAAAVAALLLMLLPIHRQSRPARPPDRIGFCNGPGCMPHTC